MLLRKKKSFIVSNSRFIKLILANRSVQKSSGIQVYFLSFLSSPVSCTLNQEGQEIFSIIYLTITAYHLVMIMRRYCLRNIWGKVLLYDGFVYNKKILELHKECKSNMASMDERVVVCFILEHEKPSN